MVAPLASCVCDAWLCFGVLNQSKEGNTILLVDPGLGDWGPGNKLLGLEPQGNLLVGVLDRVAAVADVATQRI